MNLRKGIMLLCWLLLSCLPLSSIGQVNDVSASFPFATAETDKKPRTPVIIGIHFIGISSKILNLHTTIIPEPFFINYDAQDKHRLGYGAGLFLSYRSEEYPLFGCQIEGAFVRHGGRLNFENFERNFYYTMDFRYDYISANILAKVYPVFTRDYPINQNPATGLNLGFGMQFNFVMSPENIYYKSNGEQTNPAFGSDLEQQQQLRNVLKGKNNVGFITSVGYELSNLTQKSLPISIDFRWVWGLTDVLETRPNSYNFAENFNRNNLYQVRLGFWLRTN